MNGVPPTRRMLFLRIATWAMVSTGGLGAWAAHAGSPTAVQGYSVPGRNPSSQMPWELFLGNAAHRIIAYIYGMDHPSNVVYYNTKSLYDIVTREAMGDSSRLLPAERGLKPDIIDLTVRVLFEIKPWNARGLEEGEQEVQLYLTAINRILPASQTFARGTDLQREILIRFAQGQYIWRLEWQATVPGVVQYRWTRSQRAFASEKAAYDAGQWVEITEQEMRQYGGWLDQAIEGMIARRERLASISGVMGLIIDVAGTVAVGVLSGSIFGQMGSEPQQSTGQGGKVIPMPSRAPPTASPARVPAASGM